MGDFPRNLVQAPARPRFGRAKAITIWTVTIAACLMLTSANAAPKGPASGSSIAGVDELGAPPTGPSWAPAPVTTGRLHSVATAGDGEYALHTAGGKVTFLPGVDLGSTTPGHQPGELSVTPDRYASWFAAMTWLGIRVVRIYTLHPPAFYRELGAYNYAHPDRPLYLMQGVYPPGEPSDLNDPDFRQELHDAADAVSGDLTRAAHPGRAGGTWTADVTPWLLGWIIGAELDPYASLAFDRQNAGAPAVHGSYFASTAAASPTERRLAARMDELAGFEAGRGLSQPIAFVNWPTDDPLRHPSTSTEQDDLLQLDANHVRATEAWPGGTFASYHAYPYYPDFQRHEALGPDPYAGYLALLKKHHGSMPTMVTEFGVPSSIGSAHNGPLGRSQGGHSERQAMTIDAQLLRVIHDQGLAGGFVFEWADEWYKSSWNTVKHQNPERRQLWHDPLTSAQYAGLIATDPAGSPDAIPAYLVDDENAWPARRVTASIDESYVYLRVLLGRSPPSALTLDFDVLPALTGPPPPGSGDRWADVALTLDLVAHTGQAYLRQELDPLALDQPVPVAARGPAPAGWRRFELIVDRDPLELQNAGNLGYGLPEQDSSALWHVEGDDDVIVRVPWAMLGYSDPSAHEAGMPAQISPGVGMTVSASGTDQQTGEVTWVNWNRPYWTERLKDGASAFRAAALDLS